MIDEEFEFLLAQYLDGALPDARRAEVDARLAQDSEARELLETYRKLDAAMRAGLALPEISWDDVNAKISSAVSDQSDALYSRNRFQVRVRLAALAACALIVVGVFIHAVRQNQSVMPGQVAAIQNPVNQQPTVPQQLAEVTGPQIESATAPAVADIKLGPAPAPQTASNFDAYPNAQAVVVVRPSISIAAATDDDNSSQNSR